MKRQEKLNDNQIAQLKEYLRTSESKKEAYRIQAALIVNRDMDIEIIKERDCRQLNKSGAKISILETTI